MPWRDARCRWSRATQEATSQPGSRRGSGTARAGLRRTTALGRGLAPQERNGCEVHGGRAQRGVPVPVCVCLGGSPKLEPSPLLLAEPPICKAPQQRLQFRHPLTIDRSCGRSFCNLSCPGKTSLLHPAGQRTQTSVVQAFLPHYLYAGAAGTAAGEAAASGPQGWVGQEAAVPGDFSASLSR